MDTSLTIRSEKPSDIEAIHTLNEQCFPTKGEACLVDALRDARRLTISLVAVEKDERVIGHIAFSPVRTDTGEEGLGLAPVCVDKVHRRRGVGAMLVQRGVEACREAGCGWVVVLGQPSFYSRFGFEEASKFGFSSEYGEGPEFRVVELREGALPWRAGLVRYSDEFRDLE